ncbi:MAG: hypothetical protein AAF266_07045 [Planctomycetota bacterium]
MNRSNRWTVRSGISKIELITCLLAVAGGVWIGAQYVGLDLQGAAYQALDETELLTQIPTEWRPVNPECPDGDCPSEADLRRVEEQRLQAELEELRYEVARLAGGKPPIDLADAKASSLTAEQQQARDRTQAYWQGLSEIVFEVTAIQQRVAPFKGTDEQSRALAVRRRALDYGEEAIQVLDTEGVDSEAITTGYRVAEWFGHGSETLNKALELRSRQPVGGRAMSAADVWAYTEADLQKRTDLVRRKSQETSAYLTSKFFAEFPPLGL